MGHTDGGSMRVGEYRYWSPRVSGLHKWSNGVSNVADGENLFEDKISSFLIFFFLDNRQYLIKQCHNFFMTEITIKCIFNIKYYDLLNYSHNLKYVKKFNFYDTYLGEDE